MTTSTPTLTLIGFLGKDVELRLTTPRDFTHTVFDPIIEEDVVCEGTTPVREFATLSLAVHQGSGSNRTTKWHQLRVWNLDQHPDEARIRTARKGQRVEVQGHWDIHRSTDSTTGEQREFRHLVVTSFRPRPGRLLRKGERSPLP